MDNTKPEPVEAHRCPKCDLSKVWGSEEAQEHVDMEVDTPLPKGLIYFDHSIGGWLVVIADEGRINSNHSYTHTTLRGAYYSFSRTRMDSREFKRKLRQGVYSLAKPEKMSYYNAETKCRHLLGMIHSKEFVRSNPELEEIVAQREAAK